MDNDFLVRLQQIVNELVDRVPPVAPVRDPGAQQRPRPAAQQRGFRFSRTVIVIPNPNQNHLPRGRERNALRTQNLERLVNFRVDMTAQEARGEVLTTFQGFGHMEDRFVCYCCCVLLKSCFELIYFLMCFLNRRQQDFAYMWPERDNRLTLVPLERAVEDSLNGLAIRTRWRANRPVYIRPFVRLTTFRQVR